VIAIPLPLNRSKWNTISFASTLYLCPILDLLLERIPAEWRPEVRLGLQEALVNAAKHGNKLDPCKTVVVHFLITEEEYSWVISDEGSGFMPECSCHNHSNHADRAEEHLPPDESENGRGLCILHQVFDRVNWNPQGTQLRLCKSVRRDRSRQPLVT
jgi:anti-sigma regulatory factor (Ser/Thr protein kinase)